MTLEVLTAILVAILAIVSATMLILAAGASIGVLRFSRCERCDHLAVSSTQRRVSSCIYCSHERLMHPLTTPQRSHL